MKKGIKVFSTVALILGVFLFVVSIFHLNLDKFPKLHKTYQYYRLSLLAKRFPPTSEKYKRLKAMAQAVKKGKTTYSYETKRAPLPVMDPSKNEELTKQKNEKTKQK